MATAIKTSTGHSIADLKELVKRDQHTSNDLQSRIEQLRQDIKDGKKLPKKKIDLMEVSNKDMTKELVSRIEEIEATDMTATDREMLQALNARLAVCDAQAMRLAELRELEREARGEHHEFLDEELLTPPHVQRSVSAPAVPGIVEETEHFEDIETDERRPHMAPMHSSVQHYGDDEEHDHLVESYASIDSESDASGWPCPYRVLGINPDTPDDKIENLIKKSVAALAVKHDPRRLPNDPEAPERWAVIEKCRDVLMSVEKRRFLLHQRQLPVELKNIDLAKLNLE
ncbi:hypothetical protein AMS68_006079 [Peltaster fructicola]|uniref:J domain-containing protein n=1 Tax=Peltaster fructicola TaxID=286661 RepID=A0A6H0Y0K5_9PEZI|nr:hypothetical protein AMS68_006079 [Peltaster fructicola]